MQSEVWVLGATGRTGRVIAKRLHERGIPLVLIGRDHARLEGVAAMLGGAPRLLEGSLESVLATLAQDAPGVVVNTVGPFTSTATEVAQACPPGTHYVDVSNEYPSVDSILRRNQRAIDQDQVFVTAAGFGVLATEALVLRLCAGQPRPTQVRVDARASLAIEAGVIGTALAATVAEIASFGGREVRRGALVRARTGAHFMMLTTPDGDVLGTGSGPTGDLIAAWRASGADTVVAASTFTPTNALVRFALPLLSVPFRIPTISRFVVSRIARIRLRPGPMARSSSWGHAYVEWSDGTVRDGWLRVGDGTDFTAAVAAEVTHRLLKGEGRPGAYTPGALFGPELAEAVGGTFILNQIPTKG